MRSKEAQYMRWDRCRLDSLPYSIRIDATEAGEVVDGVAMLEWDVKNDPQIGRRTLHLPPTVVETLREWRSTCDSSPYLFADLERLGWFDRQMAARPGWYKPGTTNIVNSLSAGFRAIRVEAKIANDRFGVLHDLRDTFAYRLLKVEKMDIGSVASLLGDTSETVSKFYDTLTDVEMGVAADVMERMARRAGKSGYKSTDVPQSGLAGA